MCLGYPFYYSFSLFSAFSTSPRYFRLSLEILFIYLAASPVRYLIFVVARNAIRAFVAVTEPMGNRPVKPAEPPGPHILAHRA